MSAMVFKNARMVLPGEVVQGSLQVADGRIAVCNLARSGW